MATTWKYKLALLVLFVIAYAVFYILPNFRPPLTPMTMPLLPVDSTTPFIPWTFLIYVSEYVFGAVAIILLQGEDFRAFARTAFATLILCGVFFIFFPTCYPRPEVMPEANAFFTWLMNLVWTADTPNNCFPSMHVAVIGTMVWCLRHQSPARMAFFCLWAIAICVSTLTTKQHYLLDIIGGIGVTITVAVADTALARGWIRRARLFNRPPPAR